MGKKLDERVSEFTDERFMDHISRLAELGLEADKALGMCDTISFLTDLQKLVTEIKNEKAI